MSQLTIFPISKTELESEISEQLDKIAETGKKFRDQILELGEKLNFLQEAEGQKVQELQGQSSSCCVDWEKSIETKMQKITNVQHKVYEDVRELEERRLNVQELMAGKVEDVLKDVATLKSWTEMTRKLKPKLEEGSKTIQDLESQVEKMKRELKEKLDLLELASKSNQDAVKSFLNELDVPTPEELIDADDWIVIQRRESGPQDNFERDWTEYENGFESVGGNFWLGLKKIHELTADGSMELRVELTDWDGNFGYANYSQFSVANDVDLYRLSVSGYSGNVGNSFQCHNGGRFSTHDNNNSKYAKTLKGGWWKKSIWTNLNGLYYDENEAEAKMGNDLSGVYWFTWKNTDYSLQKVLMKIRKRK